MTAFPGRILPEIAFFVEEVLHYMLFLEFLHLAYCFSSIIVLVYLFDFHFLNTFFIGLTLFFDILVLASFDIENTVPRLF